MKHIYDMIVIGGGPGGYTAALYGARAGLDVIVLEKLAPGGQMALSSRIDNYPGFADGIDGFTLGREMRRGAERFGAKTELAEVCRVELAGEIKTVETGAGTFYGRTAVFATGAEPRTLELPGESALLGRGVSYCAACDGMFYQGKTVVVAGGGNTAAGEAVQLSRICEKVIVVHRRDTLRAAKASQTLLMQAENVEFRWNSAVTGLLGGDRLTGVRVTDVRTGEESTIACDGLFVSIGRKPASALVKGQLRLDDGGYVIAAESTETELPGVFAVGDVRTKALRQIVTATADGALAAQHAEQFLARSAGPTANA